MTETPEMKAKRWLASIDLYLKYAKTAGEDSDYIIKARSKNPFLDWVLRNPDIDPVIFFEPPPPPVEKPPVPWEDESPGIPTPGQPVWFDRYGKLIEAMAKKAGITLVLILMALPAMAQTINFAWDPHEEAAQITGFKLYQSKQSNSYTITPVATFTGGSLVTGSIPQPALGRYYYVLTAFKDDAGYILESSYSNEVTLVLKPKPPKLNSAIQVIASTISKPFTYLAGLIRKDKRNLKIEKY